MQICARVLIGWVPLFFCWVDGTWRQVNLSGNKIRVIRQASIAMLPLSLAQANDGFEFVRDQFRKIVWSIVMIIDSFINYVTTISLEWTHPWQTILCWAPIDHTSIRLRHCSTSERCLARLSHISIASAIPSDPYQLLETESMLDWTDRFFAQQWTLIDWLLVGAY